MVDSHPTPYPDVNAALRLLLAEVQAILAEDFVGLYVGGSLAGGGFTPGRSDVDFLVVTVDELPARMLPALRGLHRRIAASGLPWTDVLEGPYVPRAALRHYDPARAYYPACRVDGSFDVDFHGSGWLIQCHVLRERGLTVAGPPIRDLLDPLPPEALRRAARGILHEWWQPLLADPWRLRDSEYQAYAVLTMCRALYTLAHSDVAPKAAAASWAQETLGAPWAALIARAAAWRHGMALDALDEVLGLIRETLARAEL